MRAYISGAAISSVSFPVKVPVRTSHSQLPAENSKDEEMRIVEAVAPGHNEFKVRTGSSWVIVLSPVRRPLRNSIIKAHN